MHPHATWEAFSFNDVWVTFKDPLDSFEFLDDNKLNWHLITTPEGLNAFTNWSPQGIVVINAEAAQKRSVDPRWVTKAKGRVYYVSEEDVQGIQEGKITCTVIRLRLFRAVIARRQLNREMCTP